MVGDELDVSFVPVTIRLTGNVIKKSAGLIKLRDYYTSGASSQIELESGISHLDWNERKKKRNFFWTKLKLYGLMKLYESF